MRKEVATSRRRNFSYKRRSMSGILNPLAAGERAITRLNDYMRAEVPDVTEPASFYVPGAVDWFEARAKRVRRIFPNDIEVDAEPLESIDLQEVSESAAAEMADSLKYLEG